MTAARPGRGRLVGAGAVVAAIVVLLTAVIVHAWYEQEPPALDESGTGTVLRLAVESGGVPPPKVHVQLQNGASGSVWMGGITTAAGRPAGLVVVEPSGGQARQLTLAEGQSSATGGLQVTMLHVWRMPDSANDAIDVRVVPSP